MKIQEHMQMLGFDVADKVSGRAGVVTSISFDLFGCIQALVTPKVNPDGKQEDSWWFDVQRLAVTGSKPVLPMPNYERGYVSEGRKGPVDKPRARY